MPKVNLSLFLFVLLAVYVLGWVSLIGHELACMAVHRLEPNVTKEVSAGTGLVWWVLWIRR